MTDKQEPVEQRIAHIRIQGTPDTEIEGFVMTTRDDGLTLLSGPASDPAIIYSALHKLGEQALPLLLALWIQCPCTKQSCPRRADCETCAAYHGAKGKLPYCFREKNRWERQCAALIK